MTYNSGELTQLGHGAKTLTSYTEKHENQSQHRQVYRSLQVSTGVLLILTLLTIIVPVAHPLVRDTVT